MAFIFGLTKNHSIRKYISFLNNIAKEKKKLPSSFPDLEALYSDCCVTEHDDL